MPTVTPSLTSPDVGNYVVGRGIVSIQLPGEDVYTDCGNCTEFSMTVTPTKLPHYNSREGTQKKDFVGITRLDATAMFILEEWTARNVAFALLGIPQESGDVTINMFTNPLYYAAIKVVQTNSIGPEYTWVFPLTIISPRGAIELIARGSGEWATIQLDADVLFDSVTQQFCIASSTSFA